MSDFINDLSIPVPPEPPEPPLLARPGWPQRPVFPGPSPIGPGQPSLPIGSIIAFAGQIADVPNPPQHQTDIEPLGWLKCDGRSLYIVEYADLFEAIGYRYSETKSGDRFNVPDYQGYFLRGVDESGKVDKDRTDREVGSLQDDALQAHAHNYQAVKFAAVSQPDTGAGPPPASPEPTDGPITQKGKPQVKVSDNETRPVNIYVYFLIKAF
jgi:microcystin-dependent protein